MSVFSLADRGSVSGAYVGGPVTADICIIGGGIAGLILARSLARRGRRVVVLESGVDPNAEFGRRLNDVVMTADPFTSAVHGRFRGLGGSSSRWGGRFLPITPQESGAREHLGLAPWPRQPNELEKHRDELEQLFALPVGSYEASALDRLARADRVPRNDPHFSVRVPKWAPFNRVNLGMALHRELSNSASIEVLLDATVVSINIAESGRVERVTARSSTGRSIVVATDEYVLAAGTIENARLLLVCDRDYNERIFGVGHALGRYLQEHVGTKVADLRLQNRARANRLFGYHFEGSSRRSLHLDLAGRAQREDGIAAAFAHVTMQPRPNSSTEALKRLLRSRQHSNHLVRSEVASILRAPGDLSRGLWWRVRHQQHYWPADLDHQLNIWIEQVPRIENRVALSEYSDQFGVPKAVISWSLGDLELQTIRATAERIDCFWRRQQLNQIAALQWTEAIRRDCEHLLRADVAQLNHPSGSTRMGLDPETSVVDGHLRCHRLPNLSVVGASVFPTAGATGPTYTIGLMAIDLADRLSSQR